MRGKNRNCEQKRSVIFPLHSSPSHSPSLFLSLPLPLPPLSAPLPLSPSLPPSLPLDGASPDGPADGDGAAPAGVSSVASGQGNLSTGRPDRARASHRLPGAWPGFRPGGGASLWEAQGTPYHKRKTHRIEPPILGRGPN